MIKTIKYIIIKTHLLFLYTILFFFFIGRAEANTDSLKQIWINEAQPDSIRFKAIENFYIKYSNSQPDSVFELTIYHYDLAERKNSKREMVKALNDRTFALCIKGKQDEALVEMNKAVDILSHLDDKIGLAKVYNNMGSVYLFQHKYQESIKYYSKSLDFYQNQKEEKFIQAEILNNIGLVYYQINHFELALEYYHKALEFYRETETENQIGNIWLNIGMIDLKEKRYHQAIRNNQKAIKIFQSINDQFSLANSYVLFAEAYKELSQIDTALFYAKKSFEINKFTGSKNQILADKLLIANLIFDTDLQEASKMGKEVLKEVEDTPGYSMKANVHQLLYRYYKEKGNYPLSLTMHEKYLIYNDSLLIEKDNIAVIREAIQSDYETKLFDKQLENEQAQSQLKLNQLKRTYTILLISSIIVLLIFFYARAKNRTHLKQKETLLNEIKHLKSIGNSSINLSPQGFQLDRNKIETAIGRKVNETDWKVLNILSDDPVISNKEIAQKAFLTVDGIGSCLRRMYIAFEVKESKYKKISLIMKAIKLSTN